MTDIMVTTPLSMERVAEKEAANCKRQGGGYYFRRLSTFPKQLKVGDRVYYVERFKIRGFCIVDNLIHLDSGRWCDTSGEYWSPGWYVFMRADSWKWIEPIPHSNFQSWRYFPANLQVKIIGDWLAPRPYEEDYVR